MQNYGYRCSVCRKLLPSPEAGSAHLEKRHGGYGYLTWWRRQNPPGRTKLRGTAA